jgi:hypothetical protein
LGFGSDRADREDASIPSYDKLIIQECNVTSSTTEVDVGTNVVGVHFDKVDLIDSNVFKRFFMHFPLQRI